MSKSEFINAVAASNPNQPEFLQAVVEVVDSIWDIYQDNPIFQDASILERLVEPERVILFRVPWVDDQSVVRVNRGFRVEFNSAIGPYKGGLRFHQSVNLSILKFLGFEQIFKNALTTLPMGGGKGGSDFNFRGRSDGEIMRFCQSFMIELQRHIGSRTDIPAGDIGVGAREIGYLYGQYKRIKNEFTGVLTGKGITWGGSLIRPEATGFGVVYFADEMLKNAGKSFKGKKVAISGFGNVAWGAATKVNELGGKVVTLSGPDGYIYDPDGICDEKINYMLMLRASNNDIVAPYVQEFSNATFYPGKRPWEQAVDIALPCATQNELDKNDAEMLVKNGCICVAAGANMPSTPEAVKVFEDAKLLYAPGKASNAGGVATSGLEMSQNYMGLSWTSEKVEKELHHIMVRIHEQCVEHGRINDGYVDYVRGANVAGFLKVAHAMVEQGII
ncbi:MAG: NADP-specific glutamate dehydrogenase [Candidatus Marinimicrobia bacterium]|nr:NADP-specific glutamate dehydrogenase [Candidatus Neomarinimicrobiota bacterium]